MIILTKDNTGEKVCIIPQNIAYFEGANSRDHGSITKIVFCALASDGNNTKNLAIFVRESFIEVSNIVDRNLNM